MSCLDWVLQARAYKNSSVASPVVTSTQKTDNKMFCCQFSVPSDKMSTYKGDQEKGGNTPNHKQPKHFHINGAERNCPLDG